MKTLFFYFFVLLNGLLVATATFNPFTSTDKDCLTNVTLKAAKEHGKVHDLPDADQIKPKYFGQREYMPSTACGWYLHSVNGTGIVTIKFGRFDVEKSKHCDRYDNVKIYKQEHGQKVWEQVGEPEGYCGQLEPFTLPSEVAESMFIQFITDERVNGAGWNASAVVNYSPKPANIMCLGEVNDKTCSRNVSVKQKGSVSIKCQVRSDPKAEVVWSRVIPHKGSPKLRWDMIKSEVNDTWNLHNVKLEDAGYYKCTARNKHHIDEAFFYLHVIEKCKCPEKIQTVWYNFPPYTQYTTAFDRHQNPVYKGIFYTILNKMLKEVCGKCLQGHGKSEITWSSVKNRQQMLLKVKEKINQQKFDVAFPILAPKTTEKYGENYFLPLVKTPGILYLVAKDKEGGYAVFGALWNIAPVLVITIVLMILAGIVVWMLDMYWNSEEFPPTYLSGILEGVWWAYITMTTVGYGDIAPRGYLGRMFAVFWIMTGLVIISILTGAISTALTIASLESSIDVYGADLAALNHSDEYRYGVSKAATMTGYETYKAMADNVDKNIKDRNGNPLQGCLVDRYVATYHNELLILKQNSLLDLKDQYYGVVFGDFLKDPSIYTEFKEFVDRSEVFIEQVVQQNIEVVPKNEPFNLMDPTSPMYIAALLSCLGMLCLFSLVGLTFEYAYLKPKELQIMEAKNLEMIESDQLRDMAKSTQIMKEVLVEEVENFYSSWGERLNNLNFKHDEQKAYYEEIHECKLPKEEKENEFEMRMHGDEFEMTTPENEFEMRIHEDEFEMKTPENEFEMRMHEDEFEMTTPENEFEMRMHEDEFEMTTPENEFESPEIQEQNEFHMSTAELDTVDENV